MNVLKKNKEKSISYLSFKIGDEVFATHVLQVNNMVEKPAITKIPKTPDYLPGVINLRGKVLPAIDTRIRFGMSPVEITNNTFNLALNVQSGNAIVLAGALVDPVREIAVEQ